MQQGARQFKSCGIALLREFRQVRTAWIRQAHELGRLVKGFARCIVNAFAQQLVTANAVYPHELGVPARHQQGHKRKLGRVRT